MSERGEVALRHGYTNSTRREGTTVRKTYRGPDAEQRQASEVAAIERLAGRFPVPEIVDNAPGVLTTRFVEGRHGQELLDEADPVAVLRTVGATLRSLNAIAPGLVHGDFGPQNMLLDGDGQTCLCVLDWEWARAGDPLTDLAWAEWIVRAHHPERIPALTGLFEGYGAEPAWPDRRRAMRERAEQHRALSDRLSLEGGGIWAERIDAIESW